MTQRSKLHDLVSIALATIALVSGPLLSSAVSAEASSRHESRYGALDYDCPGTPADDPLTLLRINTIL